LSQRTKIDAFSGIFRFGTKKRLGAFGDEKCDMGIYGVFEEVVFRLTKKSL